MHDLPLLTTIAAAFTVAWLLGLFTQRLGLSPIVGYLVGGVLIGPYTPGFVGDPEVAHELAEIGVILLMFGVGLHFHLDDLLSVRRVAIPGAVVQSAVATLASIAVFGALGMPTRSSAVLGMAMAVASTVVLMRVLMDSDALGSHEGHVAVGWLIVEDVLTVIALMLLPVMADGGADGAATALVPRFGFAFLKLGALVAIVMVGGSRLVPRLLERIARLRSRELFTLTVLVLSIAVAAGAYYLFGASMALGAFLAGMVVGQSPVSHQAAADVLPLRDAFAVLFFVSVGMLLNPSFLINQPLLVLAALGVILVAKPLAALVIVFVLGHSVRTALTVGIGLAQIGEFSFILAQLAREHGLLGDEGTNILVAGAIVSISLNPMLFGALPKLEAGLRARPRLWALLSSRSERRARSVSGVETVAAAPESGARELAIVVGYGPVGRAVNRLLVDARIETVVIDLSAETIAALRDQGQAALYGDATNESILAEAGARRASHLIVTVPQAADQLAIIATARRLNRGLRILARARYLRERDELERSGVAAAVFEEAEAAVALARIVLADTGVHREAAEEKVRDLRLQLVRENLTGLRSQKVRSVMVPWSRVQFLSSGADKATVLRRIARERFSRWPVVDPTTGAAVGYLLAKDLVAEASTGSDWSALVRPLATVSGDDSIEATLARMQGEAATVFAVGAAEGSAPLGILTLEDILEQVVGRIEDEYPHDAGLALANLVAEGGLALDLAGSSIEAAIRELSALVPERRLPFGVKIADLALAREAEFATDLGNGLAVPHARCPELAAPLVVLGRSRQGIAFAGSGELSSCPSRFSSHHAQ